MCVAISKNEKFPTIVRNGLFYDLKICPRGR